MEFHSYSIEHLRPVEERINEMRHSPDRLTSENPESEHTFSTRIASIRESRSSAAILEDIQALTVNPSLDQGPKAG